MENIKRIIKLVNAQLILIFLNFILAIFRTQSVSKLKIRTALMQLISNLFFIPVKMLDNNIRDDLEINSKRKLIEVLMTPEF
ncbi:hypothetical protein ATX59_07450 [Oenococcus oeni]|uniref:Uncharacterized protein n=1 Tax=Oenococcus oeni TaxID=1247 RepID=A0A6N4A085_OENOE|nr:hypothetical protein ATX59_07450 [Oenococcus oeni]